MLSILVTSWCRFIGGSWLLLFVDVARPFPFSVCVRLGCDWECESGGSFRFLLFGGGAVGVCLLFLYIVLLCIVCWLGDGEGEASIGRARLRRVVVVGIPWEMQGVFIMRTGHMPFGSTAYCRLVCIVFGLTVLMEGAGGDGRL